MKEVATFCRLCSATCGLVVTLDESSRAVKVAGDRSHPLSQGYVCSKGLASGRYTTAESRILRPLLRRSDGGYVEVGVEDALDVVADRLRRVVDRHGAEAVALYGGTQGYFNSAGAVLAPAFASALGTAAFFSPWTIDQSAKTVTAGRLGTWSAGRQSWDNADVWLIFGSNPLVSATTGAGNSSWHVAGQFRDAVDRGLQLVVVDPRRTETARLAHLHLQPVPGEDAAIAACLVREVLIRGWYDEEFCASYVDGLDDLARGVAGFTPEAVGRRAGVPAGDLVEAARLLAKGPRGCAGTSTGATMGPHSNLTDHLVECLNVVLGRYRRAGEPVGNPGVTTPRTERYAEVVPPARPWDQVPRTRVRGLGRIPSVYGGMELPCAVMAEEILVPGPGQLRAMLVLGGNPVSAVPGRTAIEAAFEDLELLVAVEPFHTATSRRAHVVFPSRLQLERADLSMTAGRSPVPFTQWTERVVPDPPGSDLANDAYVLWALAARLGLQLEVAGHKFDVTVPPSTYEVMERATAHGQVPLREVARHPHGSVFDLPPQVVQPGRSDARFEVMPGDVAGELADVRCAASRPEHLPFRLVVRRTREAVNSLGPGLPWVARRLATNPLGVHPEDLEDMGCLDGAWIEVRSAHGQVRAQAAADPSLRRGVVSLSHAWGDQVGADVNALLRADVDHEDVNGMPRMTAVPVSLTPAAG
ncbi:molybdopterin-dependent oxidoreductase [Streptomyces hirsutus]|uniref:molybdopterin-containing oxidoreductase family protein n=1 Tax=Streptomyces hirsutus TaxID=35620 RepID=UPI0034424C6D